MPARAARAAAGPARPAPLDAEIHPTLDYILGEAGKALRLPKAQVEAFLKALRPARRVFLYGRGRSGFVARAFAVRLMHLGFQTYVIGETITAPVKRDDVVVLVSGSGSTYPVVMTAELGRRQGATVVAITASPESEIARLAHVVVPIVPAPGNGERASLAPLGTVFETSAWLFFDAVVAILMARMGETEQSMRQRHATLE